MILFVGDFLQSAANSSQEAFVSCVMFLSCRESLVLTGPSPDIELYCTLESKYSIVLSVGSSKVLTLFYFVVLGIFIYIFLML